MPMPLALLPSSEQTAPLQQRIHPPPLAPAVEGLLILFLAEQVPSADHSPMPHLHSPNIFTI